MRHAAFVTAVALGMVASVSVLEAQIPSLAVQPLECIPYEGHAPVWSAVLPASEDADVRAYFRRVDHGDYYYVPMTWHDDEGLWWGVLPVPEPQNVEAEYYVAVYGPDGRVLAQSEVRRAPVTDDCEVDLTDPQEDRSDALVIGESTLAQKFRKVAWWQCEGVAQRIDVFGELRDDEACHAGIVWWRRPALLIPLAGVTTIVDDEPLPRELSPANP